MFNFSRKQKYYLRKLISYTPFYKKLYNSFSMSIEDDEKKKKLYNIVKYAANNVPYYSNYKNYISKDYKSLDISKLPLLHKEDVANHGEEMVSRKFKKSSLLKIGTGGTTGTSVNIYQSFKESILYTANKNHLYEMAGKDAIICTIREHDLKKNEPYSFFGKFLMLGPNKININTIEFYWAIIKKYKVSCIHAFPTAILMLCKLLEKKGITPDNSIKYIIGSSEIFSDEKKILIKKCFPNATIIDYYGLTEVVCQAIKIDFGEVKFIESIGYVELNEIETKHNGNKIAEIIATSYDRKAMPLIRYATGDFVEIDKEGKILSIIGRTSDFLIGRKGQVIPCIIENRERTMENVLLVQYYQDTPGEFIYNIMVNDKYTEKDERAIYEDIKVNFGDELIGKINVVDHIDKTARGKHKKIIQKLDVNFYLNK